MGEDGITTNIGNYGLCIFNDYQNNNFKPFIDYRTEEYL